MINEFNEISYAEAIIKSGFQTNRRMYELNILAKYYFWKGKKPKEVYNLLIDFCQQNFEEFNETKYFERIQSIVKNAQRVEIHEAGSIPVSNSDLAYIESLGKDEKFNRVLLGLMAMKKIRRSIHQEEYLNCKYSKFARYCKLPRTKDIFPIIKELSDLGAVRVCRNSNLQLLMPISYDDTVFTIHDFYNVGSYWSSYKKKGKYTHCECCGKLIRVKGVWRKYCSECFREKHREQSREYMRKARC